MLTSQELKQICLEAGADDVGFVSIDDPAVADQREDLVRCLPRVGTLISIVVRMNREPIRSINRSLANLEFHKTGDQADKAARQIVRVLEDRGIRASNPPMAFPMEVADFPDKSWVVSHKPVAVAAGLGQMGLHRNVIHPRFGSFVLLATVLMEGSLDENSSPISFNPCFSCKLCVAACPVGAISPDGDFQFSACYTHNYREFMGGFQDWVESVAESGSRNGYRQRFSDGETVSVWQSLSYGPNYKAANCLAVCPAGSEVIAGYQASQPQFLREIVKPLQQKQETVYVVEGSDAQSYLRRRFPHKKERVVSGMRPTTVKNFLHGLKLTFQKQKSTGLRANYLFEFSGAEALKAAVQIHDGQLQVVTDASKLAELRPDLHIRADSKTWIAFIRKEISLPRALITGRVRLRGRLSLLPAFGRCFPS